MTRKDYELIAKVLREARQDFEGQTDTAKADVGLITILTIRMANSLAEENDKFDRQRFIAACK